MQPGELRSAAKSGLTSRLVRAHLRPRRLLVGGALASVVVVMSALVPTASSHPQAVKAAAVKTSQVSFTLSMQNANIKLSDPLTYEIVQKFEKLHPNVKVVVSGEPVDQHEAKIEAAAQSHTLPDVFWVIPVLALPLAKNGSLLNLAPMFKALNITKNFPTTALRVYTEHGVLYGMPYQPLVTGFFYNKALLKQYNVALPTTIDDLVAAAKTFSSHNLITLAQGAKTTDFAVWAFLIMLDRYGYESIYQNILDHKVSYNNPAFLRFYTHLQDLQKAGAFPSNVATQTYDQAVQEFLSGQAVMLDAGVWATSQIQSSPIGKNVGFWWGPTFGDGVGKQQIQMNVPDAPFVVSAAVKRNAAKYAAIQQFVKFYYSNVGQQIFVKHGQPPVTNYVPKVNATTQPLFADIIKQLHKPGWSSALFQPDQPLPASVGSAIYQSMNGIFEGIYSPEQALKVVDTAVKQAKP
jgi:raffinose/stachyose/melibiose transport system substrate-binding protein